MYARSAINVKPVKRRLRSAAVVSERGAISGGWARPCVLIFIFRGRVCQCADVNIHGLGCKERGESNDSSQLGGPENDDLIVYSSN